MTDVLYDVRHPLPAEVAGYVALLRGRERAGEIRPIQSNIYLHEVNAQGWPLRAIANALNGVSVEAVRERIAKGREAPAGTYHDGPPIPPSPGRSAEPAEADAVVVATGRGYAIPEATARRMAELQAIARHVRGTTPANDPRRQASQDLSDMMHAEKERGATFVQIAEAAGVTWSAVKFRLGRYKHYRLPPSMAHTELGLRTR